MLPLWAHLCRDRILPAIMPVKHMWGAIAGQSAMKPPEKECRSVHFIREQRGRNFSAELALKHHSGQ